MHLLIFAILTIGSAGALVLRPLDIFSNGMWLVFLSYYWLGSFAMTAGYHRLWTHRAYTAKPIFEYFLVFFSSSAFAGTISAWRRLHLEQHHREEKEEEEEEKRSSAAERWKIHLQWTFLTNGAKSSSSSNSSSSNSNSSNDDNEAKPSSSAAVVFQGRWYLWVSLASGLVVPSLLGWWVTGKPVGSLLWVGCVRSLLQNQVSALLHTWPRLSSRRPYNDRSSMGDSLFLALLSFGDGFQNFHREYPSDFRSGVRKYHWDPTKWVLRSLGLLGVVGDLNTTPKKEWMGARLRTSRKRLETEMTRVDSQMGTVPECALPSLSWPEIREQVDHANKKWVVIDGIVYNVADFLATHPGGKQILMDEVGKDATLKFNGDVYRHSKAARNLLGPLRVALLHANEPSLVKPVQ